jgi:two-component sensor histidine kinase
MHHFNGDQDKILPLAKEGIALENLPLADYSNFNITFSRYYANENELDSALHYGLKAYDLDKEIFDIKSLPSTCSILVDIYKKKGSYEKAIEYLIEANSYRKNENSNFEVYYLEEMASLMMYTRNIDKAQKYSEEGILLARELGLKSTLASQLITRAGIYEIEGKYEEAITLYKEAQDINKEVNKPLIKVKTALGIFSSKLKLKRDIPQSELDTLLNINESKFKLTSQRIKLKHLMLLTDQGIKVKDFDKSYNALETYFKAEDKLYDLRELYLIAYNYYNSVAQYKSAVSALSKHTKYNDVLYKERQEFRILDLEAKYEKAQDEKKINQLAEINKDQANILRTSTIFLTTLGIGISFISLLFFLLYRYYKKATLQNTIVVEALKEKDFLLREIHHRVKNNLQVISSLLSLQARQIGDKKIQKAINEGRSRVRSMALIHQNLYQNENLTGVSVERYLSNLLSELFDTYKVDSDKIKLHYDIQDIDLDVDTMVPFGLILNELISNCLKHAFPNNRTGNINIKLEEKNNVLILSVIDDGVGMMNDLCKDNNSFGNRLIKAFTSKLKADLTITHNQGTEVHIKIKNYKKAS